MPDDSELLRQYAEHRSQEAFAELVRRHLALVYHCALRICGDRHRAEDISQLVFSDLARKAAGLASRPALEGWLHTGTRYAALRVLRSERRRRAREHAAEAMRAAAGPSGADPGPEEIRPLVDDALHVLGERDCEAVLLRFFEGRPFAEIAARLSVSEDAARMRVDRALDRMRAHLRRRGVTSSAAAVAGALAAPSVALPAEVAAGVAKAAMAAAAAHSLLPLMSTTKFQAAALLAVASAGTAAILYEHHSNVRLRAQLASFHAPLVPQGAGARPPGAAAAAGGGAGAHPPAVSPLSAPAASSGAVALAKGLTDVKALGNAGRATPRAAFTTQLWAARTGDVALEASVITFGPQARDLLESLAPTLPQDLRAEYDTPEKLMAFMMAGSPRPVAGAVVLGETQVDATDVSLQTEWQHVGDSYVHDTTVELQQDAGGWKIVLPYALVSRAASYLSSTLAAAPASGN